MALPLADIVAVDIGGTRTRSAIVAGSEVCAETFQEFPTAGFATGDALVETLAHQAMPGAAGIGISVPGFLTPDSSAVAYCPNTPLLANYPLRQKLYDATGLPVVLEVDCNAAAMAEYTFGAGRGCERLLVLSLGTGVGAGFVDRGSPVRITGGCFGDLGHIYVGGEQRRSAGCKGCLEANVSVEALTREGGAPMPTLIAGARAGDPQAVALFQRAGGSIGIGIASMSPFLEPRLVLLAGGISEVSDILIPAAEAAFHDYAASYFFCPIRKAAFGGGAALIGAAACLARSLEIS